MTLSSFHVLIIGGGLGGLCLAQGLKKAGISVAVYERDRTPTDRLQGYRIHIEPMGNRALHACLPSHLFETYVATSGSGGNGHRITTEHLKTLYFYAAPQHPDPDPESLDLAVSRITLRQILLAELGEIIYFDKTFMHYQETPDGKITAFFEDGTSALGDILVAADGGNSRVRHQFFPETARVETGVVSVLGKMLWTEEIKKALFIPGHFDGATSILGPKGHGMFVAVYEPHRQPSEQAGARGVSSEALERLQNSLMLDTTGDYLFWGFVARRENYAVEGDMQHLDGEALQRLIQEKVQQWHPHLQQIVRDTDPSTVICKPLYTSKPMKHWETQRITLLGDAIHSMPPTRGIGGNTALRDARLLCEQLCAARDGKKSLLQALHDYEVEMVNYGFAAVQGSLHMLDLFVADNLLGRLTATLKVMGTFMFSKSEL